MANSIFKLQEVFIQVIEKPENLLTFDKVSLEKIH